MKTLKIYPSSINERFIEQVVDTMRQGGLVIYPTDTVYAIGCDALNNRAIERICRLKGINPEKQQLSVVCSDISQASEYARIDNRAFPLLKQHLPGPVTFVLPASTRLPKIFKGRKTVGVRVPDNAIARMLADKLGNPILSASVDFDRDADEIYPEELSVKYASEIDFVIDADPSATSLSTIVDLTDTDEPTVLRQGKYDIDL